MRADYCPLVTEPCQSMCDTPCSAHRLKVAPPQASQPLTDEQIMRIQQEIIAQWQSNGGQTPGWTRLARAIEAAHGIGATQKGKP